MRSLKQIIILLYILIFLLPASSRADKIDEINNKARSGEVEAQFSLAETYYWEKGNRKDLKQAFLW